MKRANFSIRAFAYLLDQLLVTFIVVLFYYLVVRKGANHSALLGSKALEQISIDDYIGGIVVLLYYLTEVVFAATPGKLLMGLRITDGNGIKASRAHLFCRLLVKFPVIPGVLMMLAFGLMAVASLKFTPGISAFALLAMAPIAIAIGISNAVMFLGCFRALSVSKLALHDSISDTAVCYAESVLAPSNVTPVRRDFQRKSIRRHMIAVEELIFK